MRAHRVRTRPNSVTDPGATISPDASDSNAAGARATIYGNAVFQ
jgi:hypothetical protein